MKNIKFSVLFLMLFFSGIANATDYYVSASGNNSNNGTSQTTPWQTLSKVQTVCNNGTIKAGDNVFFKKGDVFTGSLLMASIWGYVANSGTATNPISFSSYGTGAKPIFQYPQGGTTVVTQRVILWFVAVDYIVVDGLNFTDLVDTTNDKVATANCGFAIYLGIPNEATTNHCTIKNIDVSLCGMGVAITGDFNTISNSTLTNFKNLINTNNGGVDDYGANAVTIIGSDNQITNNYISSAWAYSSDFGWNGGACEMYNTCNRNKIMYNTIVDCDGISEYGGEGGTTAADNLIAYNKIINCGQLSWINTTGTFAMQASNVQYFNNVVVENNLSRFSGPNVGAGNTHPLAHYPESELFGFSGTPDATVVFNLKNNIYFLSTGIDITRSSYATKTVHEDNIYQLSGTSITNFTLSASELSTAAAILTNTAPADPLGWNYTPIAGSPAIDFGQNLGLIRDFAGNIVPTVPNAGILETGTSGSTTFVATSSATPINCNAGTSTVTVIASGGTSPYTGTGTFTVNAGTYNYTVTDASGTVTATSITISQPAAIVVTATAGTILVFGGTTSVTVSATGGTSPYTYSINSGAFQTSNIFSSITAGTQTITVKDSKGCTSVKTITITQPAAPAPLAASSTAGTINCNGGSTIVTVTATGGTTPYTGTGNFTVNAGTYTYSVTDAAGTVKTTTITVTQPATLIATASAGSITIFGGTTSVTANATGGTGPYTYSINAGVFQTANIFSNVPAGTQTITVKDSRGCTAVKTITITQPALLVVSSAQGIINCNGGTTTVTISATGGTTPYTGTGTFTIIAGTYSYSVTDAAGSVKAISVTITQPTAIAASIVAPGVYSSIATTTATVTATGGSPAYTYSLDAGTFQTGSVFSGVGVGTHSIKVKDSKGCMYTSSFNVPLLPVTPLTISSVNGFINCHGGTTTVTISATGGFPPYTGTGVFTVPAGTNSFTVSDATGATATKSLTIVQPKEIIVSVATGAILTYGGTTTATVTATGGTGAYSYMLNAGTYQTSNIFSNITAGSYSVTVRDARNCTGVQSFTVTQPAPPPFHITLVSKTDITCKGANNGTIQVTGTYGTPPYTYKKNTGNYASTSLFTGLAPGTYTITAKDATGATSAISVIIANSNAACRMAGRADVNATTDDQPPVKGFEVTVFPNPSNTDFSLIGKSDHEGNIHITVMNMSGQKVYENNISLNRKNIFGDSFVPGIYFVKIVQNGDVKIIKLIKTK